MLQVTQAAVNNSCGAARDPGGKISLLDQQRVLSRARTLARHCHAVDAPRQSPLRESVGLPGLPVDLRLKPYGFRTRVTCCKVTKIPLAKSHFDS